MKKVVVWGFILVLVLVVVIEGAIIAGLMLQRGLKGGGGILADNKVVVVRIEDIIMDSRKVIERLDLYKDRKDIKAVVLRIETPGGAMTAAEEIVAAVRRLREEHGKVVVASIGNLGASAGYLIACQTDAVVIHPSSLTGSIGVIIEHFEVSELTKKIGVSFDPITAGRMKDAGSITRPMKPEERAHLQEVVNDVFRQFRGEVLTARRAALAAAAGVEPGDSAAIEAQLDRIADGRVLSGRQALELGLADEAGDLIRAVRLAGERAGIQGEPKIIYDNPEDSWQELEKIFGVAKFLLPGGDYSPLQRRWGAWALWQG